MIYTQDFETTTDATDCRVWAWGSYCIDNEDFQYGNSIEHFMDFIYNKEDEKKKIYFHNIKFDGDFIINYIMRNGFTWVKDKRKAKPRTFTTLISGMGDWYTIVLYLYQKKGRWVKVELYDSLKLLSFSIEEIAKTFKLEHMKGTIDYNKYRPVGHILDDEEVSYLYNDVWIAGQGLKEIFKLGWEKMTQGSNALADYIERFGGRKKFDKVFPQIPLEIDEVLRGAYKGGFTFASPQYAGKDVGQGVVFDVNSLYPSVMRYALLPYGQPIYYEGEYVHNEVHPLYIQNFTCMFEVKENHIPTYQDKTGRFVSTKYLESSRNEEGELEEVTMSMTSVDLALFKKHYNVLNIEYHDGYMFKATTGLFDEYIDYWSEQKAQAKKDKNHGLYLLSKLMLNSLYGKFGMSPKIRSKYPVYYEDIDEVKYKTGQEEVRKSLFLPMASFITAYAREKTISTCQSMYEYFAYADTDSGHFVCKENQSIDELLEICKERFDVDSYKLGAWDYEGKFKQARYLRAKSYIEYLSDPNEDNYEWKITCAGMPKPCYKYVTYDNFHYGAKYKGKLQSTRVKGGTILKEVEFSLNA